MKFLSLSAVILVAVLSLSAKAAFHQVDCVSTRNSSREFTAFVVDQELKAIRIQVGNSLPHQFQASKMAGQAVENKTLYTLLGSGQWAAVDNQVLEGQDGHIELSSEIFNCSFN